MFNVLTSIPELFLLTLSSFFILFTVRYLFIKRKIFVFLYHLFLCFALFIASIGGGSVQNDAYKRLKEFTLLEKSNQLEHAQKNPQNYDSMFQIDLGQFQTSQEFRKYLKRMDAYVDWGEAIFIGGLFVLLAEISILLSQLLTFIMTKIKSRKSVYFQ